jgi:thiol:disulfide interchange protein DsbD
MFAFLLPVTALAGGTSSPPPPTAPVVDWSALPAEADVQSVGQDGKPHPVRARLITDTPVITPGETFRIGLHLTQQEDWHTYWTSPGEIGLATMIDWSVPAGFTVGDYAFPTPQRFIAEDMVSYGYDDQVLLFAEVAVPPGTPAGPIVLGAEAEWLVCKTSCIPGSASLKLPVTVGEAPQTAAWTPLFDHFAAQHPVSADAIGYEARVVFANDGVLPNETFAAAVVLSGPGKVQPDLERFAFAPIHGDGWMIDTVTTGHVGDDLVVRLEGETFPEDPPLPDRIGGLFQIVVDGRTHAVQLEQPLPWKPEGSTLVPTEDPVLTATITPLPTAEGAPATPDHAPGTPAEAPATAAVAAPVTSDVGLLGNLLFAFLGGLILNIMPCVLPVLTLKLYSLVEQTDITPGEQRTAGLAYTGGIVASFLALAATVLVFRSALDSSVGWGFQFQYPPYVAVLVTVVYMFGLSLFGVFEIPAVGTNAASEAGSKEGPVGYFFTGVFATLLATPCSAPILGSATAFTLTASMPELLAIYTLIGLGLAFPFLVIAFVPAAYKLLPRPGAWMETFKHLLGFTLIATSIWLLGVLGAQIGMDRLMAFVGFLGFVSAACWIFGHFGGVAATLQRQAGAAGAAALVMLLGGWFWVDLEMAEAAVCDDTTLAAGELDYTEEIPWQAFSEARLAELSGSLVFVDFTAEWCVTCKVNEKTILEMPSMRRTMAELKVVPLKADWTRKDEVITKWLTRYGKAGVPFYLVIPPEGDPIPLGELITPGSVTEALKTASASG